ncbi:MAG TPA: glycosyltransferase [Candidatus Krumholzibacteria bacterium]|nr:glycosyltransferase [Candidatus Krumholzibacteria bacterium]HPD71005.1 glycosyltransferase [Candidatus Krumholzibacteria bacterium]HRY39295.1 glycosyltransferase [Candidatus Krumholzibacteria bacterium]
MKRKTISLCMIARDEESYIGKAIKSALALVDEIVVVDTGSRDNTRIIAEGYGARVLDYAWHDDFAAARNTALAAAACDWILVLDCDEQLQSIRPVEFQRLLADPGVAGYRVRLFGAHGSDHSRAFPDVRLFRSHPDLRYRYPVHEQIVPSLTVHAESTGLVIADSPLVIVHDGGGADQRARKRDRNLRLLRKAVGDCQDEPYFEYQLGSEMLLRLDDDVLPVAGLRTSLHHLDSAWRRVTGLPPEMRRLVAFGGFLAGDLAAVHLAIGQPAAAATIVEVARREWGDTARLCFLAARAALDQLVATDVAARRLELAGRVRRDLAAIEALPPAATPKSSRIRDLYPLVCRGDLALAESRLADAAEAYEQALSRDQDYSAAWVGLAECARVAGDRKRALRLYLRAVTASEWNVRAWERGCSLLEELGFHDNAQSWRTRVLDHFPERPQAPSDPVAVGQLLA